VTEFSYRYGSTSIGYIICSFILDGPVSASKIPWSEARALELKQIQDEMTADGIDTIDLSDDEFAKSHVRHLVGGRSSVKDERVFRFRECHWTAKCVG
jgi:threonine dehydratase